jgi:flagellar protein FliO/FliZ
MMPAFFFVFILLIALAMVPWGLRWLRLRSMGGAVATLLSTRVISAAAVGPHQRVVTVEVGPAGARVWLVLGVTAQTVSHLHTMAPDSGSDKGDAVGAKEGERAQAV